MIESTISTWDAVKAYGIADTDHGSVLLPANCHHGNRPAWLGAPVEIEGVETATRGLKATGWRVTAYPGGTPVQAWARHWNERGFCLADLPSGENVMCHVRQIVGRDLPHDGQTLELVHEPGPRGLRAAWWRPAPETSHYIPEAI